MSALLDFLQKRLAGGGWQLGQLLVRADFSIRHSEDRDLETLRIFRKPEDAREIAKYDDAGDYRPLKTAPNLRHGWLLQLSSLVEVRLALDFLYPAALANRVAFENSGLAGVPLRETLNRQTGMYRVTQLITDPQAEEVVSGVCGGGCLRRRLWNVNSSADLAAGLENSAVLCVEACNLLVAACRPVAKKNLPPAPQA